ncbi:MAG: tetratricopeptide repeat protein, partial [Candidatus Limnocylindria bacterium]
VAAYARGTTGDGDTAGAALLHAWWASALWLRGEVSACREMASRALHEAVDAADDTALAAAHTVMAMIAALDSDRRANDAHYLRALDHAGRANDVLQSIRIRANRGSRFAEEGYYPEALAELDDAIRLADLAGFAAFRALALSNRGEVLTRIGRLDEAITELESARALYQRLDSRLVSYPLGHLGEVYRQRGDMTIARAHFEEAIAVAEAAGDQQGLVPALSGLARVIVRAEPERATELAARAAGAGPVLGRAAALLAVGWVALSTGDRVASRKAADEAEALSRQRRDRAGLAEAIELGVRAAADPGAEIERLDESIALWRDIGNPIGIARVELALAELLPPEQAIPMAEHALEQLRQFGARRLAANAAHLLERLAERRSASVEITSLGGFEVLRNRRPVPLAAWRSRKARDVLKLLVAARGRRVPREQLLDTFWPEEDPSKSSPRLSVVLSTIRAVLDPAKANSADHYLGADRTSAWLRLDHLAVDCETFAASAERGLRLLAAGRPEAHDALAEAEATFHGEFLGEDPYEDWAVATREELNGIYQRVAAALAERAAAVGEHGAAVGFLLRMLERDPWDESANIRLVSVLAAAGRHGEARRAYRRYVGRMEELNLEAAAFPEPAP